MKVSIIVPTYNESRNIRQCLVSLKKQTYPNIELIIVNSLRTTDSTGNIASEFTKLVYHHGNERSSQRNYGVEKSTGDYVLIIDADMTLGPTVVAECVVQVLSNKKIVGIIIPEVSIGTTYWANCKALEKRCYVGDDSIEAARFIKKSAYVAAGGYDVSMVAGEDWDLDRRIRNFGIVSHIAAVIYHNEGHLSLLSDLKKKYYYSQKASSYIKTHVTGVKDTLKFVFRPAFFRNWRILISDPIHLPGMFVMKILEFLIGGFGTIVFQSVFWRKVFRLQSQP